MKSTIVAFVLILATIPAVFAQNNFVHALVLDGDGDYVIVADHDSLNFGDNQNYTWSAWFKTSAFEAMRILYKVQGGPFGWAVFVNFGKVWGVYWAPGCPACSIQAPSFFDVDPVTYDDGAWHHTAVVRDGMDFSIYMDGELIDSRNDLAARTLVNSSPLGIGAVPPGGISVDANFFFDGSIDEVRIWRVARTQAQIKATMRDTLSAAYYSTPDSGLAAYYRLDTFEDLGVGDAGRNDVRDFSVNALHGEKRGNATLRYVGSDDFSEPLLTMQFRGMNPHIGQKLSLRVIDRDGDKEVGRKTLDAIPSADFDVTLNVLLKDHSYDIDFYADLNGNGEYDAPLDHAWRVELSPALGSDVVLFQHNLDFTDIEWPPLIKGFFYSLYEAIWEGVGQNANGELDFSLLVRTVENREDGSKNGYVEATNVFGFFDLILVYFSGVYSEQTRTGEAIPTDGPGGKNKTTFTNRRASGSANVFGNTDWGGSLFWEDGGQIEANFLNSVPGTDIDISVDGMIGLTQGIVNYQSNFFGIEGKMFIKEDSVIAASFTSTASEERDTPLPTQTTLSQNYPNPVFPTTTIPFRLTEPADVTINLYDILGRQISTLLNMFMLSGEHEVTFDGSALPAGMYVYRMKAKQANGKTVEESKKLLIIK